MTQSMVVKQLVDQLLDDRTYDIEFNGHLTNHAKHAVVALAGLGASPQRIKEYYENYAEETPYGFGLERPRASTNTITDHNWHDFLGQRRDFAAYCAFFDKKERELGLEGLLRRFVPPLLAGWVGSFTHATIHLGWALDAGSRWMTIEGLAYLAFSYVSCHPERSCRKVDFEPRAVDSLLGTAGRWDDENGAFLQRIQSIITDTTSDSATGIHPELARSGLQYRIARLLSEGHPSFYAIPEWIDEHDVSTCWEQLYYTATLVYAAAPGNFILLHLITSLYAMEKIAEWLPIGQQRYALRCFWIGMFPILLSEGTPPDRRTLEKLHGTYDNAVDTSDAAGPDWDDIVARAIEEEEEHNPKMVYVLRTLWRRTGGKSIYRTAADRFTKTPELPPTFDAPPTE
jgi:Questin oxidase-like